MPIRAFETSTRLHFTAPPRKTSTILLQAPLELVAVTACLSCALPAAIAAFPQKLALATASLEPRFHGIKHPATGEPVDTVYSNKGL